MAMIMFEYTYLVSPNFDPTCIPDGYIWDENAFQELVKATDKAAADQTIYVYGGAQGDNDVVYFNAADLTISNQRYNGDGQVVDTTITANTFVNTGTVTTDGAIAFSVQNFSNSGTFNLDNAASLTANGTITNIGTLHITIQAGNENCIVANVFDNAEGNGKITIGGSYDGGVTIVISANEGDVKVSDITLTVTSTSGGEVTASVHGGNIALASGIDYSTIYLSNSIDEAADFTKEVHDSTDASYYVKFNAFKLPASALEDGVKNTTTTILIDGTTASALKYESETTASIDGLTFAKDGTNAASPADEEKNVEIVLTGMDSANPESYRDLKKGITVEAGVTLTLDKLRQTDEKAVTDIYGELKMGMYNTGLPDDPATTDVDESIGSDTFKVVAGHVNINGGGALYDCTVLSGGKATVYKGGYVEDIAMENGGRLDISEGGTATNTTVNNDGVIYVSSGGTAMGAMVSDGDIYVTNGGTATDVTVSNGHLYVHRGAMAAGVTLNEGGWMLMNAGCTATDVTVFGGDMYVSSGATAGGVTVSRGWLNVSSGGTATGIEWTPCMGYVYVEEGAYVTFASQYSGCYYGSEGVLLASGPALEGKVFSDYHYSMYVFEGGTATNTTMDGGYMYVSSGGTATDTTMDQGYMFVYSGGMATGCTVNDGGVRVYKGGMATNFTVSGGSVIVFSSGTAAGVTLTGVSSPLPFLRSSGLMYVGSGGMVSGATVNSNGSMYVLSGGTATGVLTLGEGAVVSADDGAVIDFDISALSTGNDALVNNLSLIQGTPTYTVTVSANQSDGDYLLAEGVANFTGTLTIRREGVPAAISITVGDTNIDGGDLSYSLILDDAKLLFSVTLNDTTPPEQPVAQASTTDPTNQNVTVTATFSDDSEVREYSLDNEAWSAYTEGVELSNNGTVWFRGTDSAGNVSEVVSYEVTNIDKVAPKAPTAKANTTAPTNQDVTVTATFSTDSAKKQYSLDNKKWNTYKKAIVFTENGKIWFRGVDAAGNVSKVTKYEVKNIDKVPPEAPVAMASTTDPTNKNVTVTATFSDDSVVKEYSLDNEAWSAYTEGVELSDNGTVWFRGTDEAGNVSEAASYEVTNIDKVVPKAPTAKANTTALTNQDVTVTATFSADSAKKQYSLDNKKWKTYSSKGVKMTDNGTVWFRGTDAAGNVSEVTSYEVTNIDKEPPAEPAFRLSGDSASREVILSARWDTDDARCFYALEGEAMEEYKDPLRFSEDTRVHFQTRDAAGNETDRRLELMLAGSPTGVWGDNYFAYNCTVAGVELEPLVGRNIIGKVCHGSEDTTILLLTDDVNGDAFFLDDIYSAAPDITTRARLSQVNQIVAGAGDDIIDLTSVRFDYDNNGISVQGGDGNDVIWANNDSSLLFGDAGDDHIVGGNDVDVIVGGAGNDTLHGGGGGDYFCFGGSWGDDTVEQLEGGMALLWFDGVEREELSLSKDADDNAVFSCEAGSVTLLGVKHDDVIDAFDAGGNVLSDNIFLQFGDSGLEGQFLVFADALRSAGAFDESSSDRIYDDSTRGRLA